MRYIISDIKLPFDADENEVLNEARMKMKRAGIPADSFEYHVCKRSIDARNKDNILQVCSVNAETADSDAKHKGDASRLNTLHIKPVEEMDLLCKIGEYGSEKSKGQPLIVGMGPAGLFCALLLAENGYSPIIIDRGDRVEERVRAVNEFYATSVLDTESNIQFGEGGAGTFSDGKLVTRINDPRCSSVLKRFHEAGAPDDILIKAKPHIGTDILRKVVASLTKKIISCGGKVIYRCRLDDIKENSDGSVTAKTNNGDINCGMVVLASGHSASDTYLMLKRKGFMLSPKNFSVGVRVEHLQEDIDRALFGKYAGRKELGSGEYNLSDTSGERGVYTFCMCPGGEVVAAASENGTVVVNGMSNHSRNGKNANCAVCVTVNGADVEQYMKSIGKYTDPIRSAIDFQRLSERSAYKLGGENYNAPVQLMGDFLNDTLSAFPKRIEPSYMGGNRYRVAALKDALPDFIVKSLKYGFLSFEHKLNGFAAPDAVLTAVESRTTSPLRLLRNQDMQAIGHDKVYPCGEGAGYAGGITSAAVDGIKCAEAIMKRFAPMAGQT